MGTKTQHLEETRPEAEVQTDKEFGKIVECNGCGRELIVNTFYAPARALCTECRDAGKEAPGGSRSGESKRRAPQEFTFNDELEVEVQTDKEETKDVPCISCNRRLVVNTFYAPGKARCTECRSGLASAGTTVVAPVPGRTDPAMAADLKKCLINPQFMRVLCPVHPEDEAHEMELKSVSHSERYGPSEFAGYSRETGMPEYRQLAEGETVLHQCLKCKATVSYSTTAQVQFGLQNKPGKHVNGWQDLLGVKEGDPALGAAKEEAA